MCLLITTELLRSENLSHSRAFSSRTFPLPEIPMLASVGSLRLSRVQIGPITPLSRYASCLLTLPPTPIHPVHPSTTPRNAFTLYAMRHKLILLHLFQFSPLMEVPTYSPVPTPLQMDAKHSGRKSSTANY